jgi:hypothetical protein
LSPADRFRDARRRGQPAWLWPEVAVADWRAALSALEASTGALLTGQRPGPLRAPDVAAERALCLAAYTSGLGPWLGWHLEQGQQDADDAAARQLALHLRHSRARWTRLSAALETTIRVLTAAGIDVTVFKGAHTAHRLFAEPGLRPMADLDVLVPRADIERAERTLADAGYEENATSRMQRPRRSEWRPPGAPVELRTLTYVHERDPYSVDLHGTLDIDFFGIRTVAFSAPAPEHTAPAPWLGPRVTVLRQPLLAAQHAVHASHGLHSLTMIRLVELTHMLQQDMRGAGDWSALRDLLSAYDGARFAYPALALAEQLAPGTVQPQLLQHCAAASPRRLRAVVGRLRPATAQQIDRFALEERFMWAAGPVEHIRRVGNMLLPTGTAGSLRQLQGLYANRAFRLLRRGVTWRSAR